MHAAERLAELVEEARREDLSPVTFLDRVLEREIECKDERRIATSLRPSGLPVGKTLEGFDWTFQPTADRSRLETLATCAFIREADNVLFMGPLGVGKSHLAVALGVKAIENGFSTPHFVLDDLMHMLKGDAAIPPRRLKARRYLNSSLLVIDEVGFRPPRPPRGEPLLPPRERALREGLDHPDLQHVEEEGTATGGTPGRLLRARRGTRGTPPANLVCV